MAKSPSTSFHSTEAHAGHQMSHHAFGFQQLLTAVTHALARKEQSRHTKVSEHTKRSLDKQRVAASSATGSWAEMLLR